MTQSFLPMILRNGTTFFEISRHQQALWPDLHTSWQKTKIQNIGTGDAPRTVHIDNQAVETVSKFTYLGSDIDSEGYSYSGYRIAGSIMAQLDNVWRQQRLRLSTKLRIYTSLVQSVVLYDSETWTMRKVDSDRIKSFHMQALRRILGIRWYDKVSNAVVNESTKLPDLPSLADRRHSLFGHILSPTGEHTCFAASQALQLSIEAHTGTPPAADLTGSVRRVVHEELGCNKWKKTLACLLVLPRLQAKIARRGGRYDPQLVS